MAISIICAWIAVICLILTSLKYVVKKNPGWNRFFHRIHIWAGVLLIAIGGIHGMLAGNPRGTSLGSAVYGDALFSLNMGTLCFLISVALGLSYCFRSKLKKKWMNIHRILTVCMIIVLVIHVVQMGITLPSLFGVDGSADASAQGSSGQSVSGGQVAGDDQVTFSGASLQDGTYQGSAEGYQSTISVSVTVEEGAVTDITITGQSETPRFFEMVQDLPETIISAQSLNVDAVTGATYSSKGILCAVYDALEEAVIDGELSITIPEPQGGHGGHGSGHGNGGGSGSGGPPQSR